MYSPRETALKVNWPPASVLAVADQSEDFERSMTMAFSTGRCWGSWTMPRTEPKTEAKAARVNIMSCVNRMMRMKRIKSPMKSLLKVRLPALWTHGYFSKRSSQHQIADGRVARLNTVRACSGDLNQATEKTRRGASGLERGDFHVRGNRTCPVEICLDILREGSRCRRSCVSPSNGADGAAAVLVAAIGAADHKLFCFQAHRIVAVMYCLA